MVKLQRVKENPILAPTDLTWENSQVFNPGAVIHEGKVLLLYRAMGTQDNLSRVGLAVSDDGIHFTRNKTPLYYGGGHKTENLGIEDIRIVEINDTFYLTYASVSGRPSGKLNLKWKDLGARVPHISLSTTKNFIHYLDYDVVIPSREGKDATLFPKKINGEYLLLFREGPNKTFIADSPHLDYWPQRFFLFDKRPGFWDSYRAGIGAPPIETEKGWLLFYHGVDEKFVYRIGIMFLDKDDPRKILYRSAEPVFEPEESYEKKGVVPNVVFTCGVIEKDDTYFVYYGAADTVVGLATVEKKDVLNLF